MIAQLLCLITTERDFCDHRIVRVVSNFVADDQIGIGCLALLGRSLAMPLAPAEQQELAEIIDASIPDVSQLVDQPGPAADHADVFLAAYTDWKLSL
jgi:hypothetical protein